MPRYTTIATTTTNATIILQLKKKQFEETTTWFEDQLFFFKLMNVLSRHEETESCASRPHIQNKDMKLRIYDNQLAVMNVSCVFPNQQTPAPKFHILVLIIRLILVDYNIMLTSRRTNATISHTQRNHFKSYKLNNQLILERLILV